jgi:Dehydrogenases with different specificities (related to short-chain alcohol dehydrogenases)
MRLKDRVVLVMGGGAEGPPAKGEKLPIGNGRAIAIQCAREGASVVVADRNLSAAEETADNIRAAGHRAHAVTCDVSNAEQVRSCVAEAAGTFGALHGLVNNVGTADMAPLTDASEEEFEQVLRVNVRGHFLAIKHAVPEIARAGGGSIVNVSSLNALRSGGGAGVAYETSKAALLGLTRHSAMAAAGQNIRVNSVLPGIIDSTMLRRYVGDQQIDFSARIPLRRMGTPWEVAKAVVFLLSDDASYVTGTELVVDGGVAASL